MLSLLRVVWVQECSIAFQDKPSFRAGFRVNFMNHNNYNLLKCVIFLLRLGRNWLVMITEVIILKFNYDWETYFPCYTIQFYLYGSTNKFYLKIFKVNSCNVACDQKYYYMTKKQNKP